MLLVSLAITDFRNIAGLTIEPDPGGTTVITGRNGAGKTSVLEAVTYLATLQSFRGSPREALVRRGTERAMLRAETLVEGRTVTIEAEISAAGRSRTMVNRQSVRRRGDLHPALRTTVFSPEDIGVVRGGPADRRRFLDETLAVVDPKAARATEEVDKILRQRTALLRTAGRRLSAEVADTLDVWDTRLDAAGTALVDSRQQLVVELGPVVEAHYSRLAGTATDVGLAYSQIVVRPAGGRPGRGPGQGRRTGRLDGRTPPGRTRAHPAGTAHPDPRLPRGAAVIGPGPAVGGPPARHRSPRNGPGTAPRRRVLRARSVPVRAPC